MEILRSIRQDLSLKDAHKERDLIIMRLTPRWLTTVRTMLAVINHKNLSANQLDVKNAFLHGNLQEKMYIKPSKGFTEKEACLQTRPCMDLTSAT